MWLGVLLLLSCTRNWGVAWVGVQARVEGVAGGGGHHFAVGGGEEGVVAFFSGVAQRLLILT